jgi:DNA-binding transcriptional ArsR family regulator
VKARKVKALDPDGPLRDNVRRIVEARAAEVRSFSPAVLDPSNVEALHDMRIAAKRLRYVLELTTPVFGAGAEQGAKRAKKLQDLLGEIHDCDVTIPRVEQHIARLRIEDAATLRQRAGSRASDLDPAAAREAPHRHRYRGLDTLDAYLRARRDVLYARFLREWVRMERFDFAGELQHQAPVTVDAQDGRPDG